MQVRRVGFLGVLVVKIGEGKKASQSVSVLASG
jgi:hypothetical protein